MHRPLNLTRELVDRLPSRVEERGPILVDAPSDSYYEDTAEMLLSSIPSVEDVWIFAAGSLIWNPRFDEVERRPATLKGWRRSFCIGPDKRVRGSPSAPGRMMSIDRGGACSGVAIRMSPDNPHNSLTNLLREEPPTPPLWLDAEDDGDRFKALTFTADPSFPLYSPEPPEEELADILASSVGFIGTMAEYLLNTVTLLGEAGIHDPYLWRLQEKVAARLERLPPRSED